MTMNTCYKMSVAYVLIFVFTHSCVFVSASRWWKGWLCSNGMVSRTWNTAVYTLQVSRTGNTAVYTLQVSRTGNTAVYTLQVSRTGNTAVYTLQVSRTGNTSGYTLQVSRTGNTYAQPAATSGPMSF